MNANIMNTLIFHSIKYELNGHLRSQNVTYVYFNLNLRCDGQLLSLFFLHYKSNCLL